MARVINPTAVLFGLGFIINTINGESPEKISFLVDKDITCTSTVLDYTIVNCNEWKDMMSSSGNNAISCEKEDSINFKTGDPYYNCGPTIFKKGKRELITSLTLEKNEKKEIVGIQVTVHHKRVAPKEITGEDIFKLIVFTTIVIGFITCVCGFPEPPPDNDSDDAFVAGWLWANMLKDDCNCSSWYDTDTVSSWGFDKCS